MTVRAEALLLVEREVGALVRRVRRVIGERAQAVHPELTSTGYLLLAQLSESGPQRASALAAQLILDKGAATRVVQQLERLGLVSRQPDPDDGRAALVALTPGAATRLTEVATSRRQTYAGSLGELSTEELTALGDLLARYNTALSRPGLADAAD